MLVYTATISVLPVFYLFHKTHYVHLERGITMESWRIFLAILLAGIGIYSIIKGFIGISSDAALSRCQVYGVGRVLSIEEIVSTDNDGHRSSSSYKTLVQIIVNNKAYTNYIHLSSNDIISFTVGSKIGLLFQGSNPTNLRYEGEKLFAPNIFHIIAGFVFIILAFFLPSFT